MVRRRLGGVLGLNPSDADLRRVTKRGPKRKLVFDREAFAAQVVVPEWIDELYSLDDGELFTLVDWRRTVSPRRVGLGFAVALPNGSTSLRWVKYRDIGRLLHDLKRPFLSLAMRHGTLHKPLPWIAEGAV